MKLVRPVARPISLLLLALTAAFRRRLEAGLPLRWNGPRLRRGRLGIARGSPARTWPPSRNGSRPTAGQWHWLKESVLLTQRDMEGPAPEGRRPSSGASGRLVLRRAVAAFETCLVESMHICSALRMAGWPRNDGFEESPDSTERRCRITPGRGNPRDSATENRRPRMRGNGETVR